MINNAIQTILIERNIKQYEVTISFKWIEVIEDEQINF
jgi:hypothetical protein